MKPIADQDQTKQTPPDQRVWLPGLQTYRAKVALRLASEFCDAPDYVAGIKVRALCPMTFSMLYATRSAFIHGGEADACDVRNYIWFHSASHCHWQAPFAKLRKWWALRKFDRVALGQNQERARVVLEQARTEIAQHVEDAFACAPMASGKPTTPLATLEAQMVHCFATAYGWSAETTRRTPLARLFQLHRMVRQSRGEDVEDAGEQRMIFRHLSERNKAAQLQEIAKRN